MNPLMMAEVAIAVPFVGGAIALLVGAVCALLIGGSRRTEPLAPKIDRASARPSEHGQLAAYGAGRG